IHVLRPKARRQKLKYAELDAGSGERLKYCAKGIGLGLVGQRDDGEMVVIDDADPSLLDFGQFVLEVYSLRMGQPAANLAAPLAKPASTSFEDGERQK